MDSPKPRMLFIGLCRLCETGPLGLRSCGQCGRVVVLCDECDAVWRDANTAASPDMADAESLPCPYCDASLNAPPSAWASLEQCEQEAWFCDARNAGGLQVREGEPLMGGSDDEPDTGAPHDASPEA